MMRLHFSERDRDASLSALKTAIVFATNETFMPLAKGLVLSCETIGVATEGFELNMVDVGCSPASIRWMKDRSIEVRRFSRSDFYDQPLEAALKPYQDALLCRPFLPNLFPGYETYIWSDADIWIQDISALRLFRSVVTTKPETLAICPVVDYSYTMFYEDMLKTISTIREWIKDAYNADVADTNSKKALLSAGIFGLHSESPYWSAWARELCSVFSRPYERPASLHLAEQTALNYLAYQTNNFTPLPAIYNYNCHGGPAMRDADGNVVIGRAPFDRIAVVHLSYSSGMIEDYMRNGLLFDRGNYLTSDDRETLRQISHY